MSELKAITVINAYQLECNDNDLVYLKSEVDAVLAGLKAENKRLNNALDKERSETIKYMDELCNAKNEIERLTIDKRNNELRADIADATIEKLKAEIRRLKRALYKVCANWAICKACILEYFCHMLNAKKWERMLNKCLVKVEEYK